MGRVHLDSFETGFRVTKVVDELGLVFGWAIVSTEDGEDYFDTQGDHIPEDAMLKAATDFMLGARESREQHVRPRAGTVVFSMPITKDLLEATGMTSSKTGLFVAVKADAEMLAKFKSGELTGFSIGGRRIEDEVVEEAE